MYKRQAEHSSPKNVLLTLDHELQRRVERIMDRRIGRGAVVIMEPDSGDILAMASRPNFKAASLPSYLQESNGALLNRALCAWQPGSLFKICLLYTSRCV